MLPELLSALTDRHNGNAPELNKNNMKYASGVDVASAHAGLEWVKSN